jgi:adenosine deaminase
MEDYVMRYGNDKVTNRTDYSSLNNILAEFSKKKKDSNCTRAEVIFEPLDVLDKQVIIDCFEKKVIDIFGKKCVVNL